jgi:Ala-tRNA(Pro) deacylase
MSMPARLRSHLEAAQAAYVPISHIPARSAQYAASLLHVPGGQVAKTVALRAGKQILLAVLPASYHLNLEKLATMLGTPVNLIEERECYRLFPDCQPGTVPPFGELYNLPVYMDKSLAAAPEIIFSAGTLSESIRMSSDEFMRLAKPQLCSFAEIGEPAPAKKDLSEVFGHEEGGGK